MKIEFDQKKREIERIKPENYLNLLEEKMLFLPTRISSHSFPMSVLYELVFRTLTSAEPLDEKRLKVLNPYLKIVIGYEITMDDVNLLFKSYFKKEPNSIKTFENNIDNLLEKGGDKLKKDLLDVCLLIAYAEGRPSYKTRFFLQKLFNNK